MIELTDRTNHPQNLNKKSKNLLLISSFCYPYKLLFPCIFLIFICSYCNKKNINWKGQYHFFEEKQFSQNNNIKLQWNYYLDVFTKNDNIKAELNINGYDLLMNIKCKGQKEGDQLFIIYKNCNNKKRENKYDFQKGDVLLILKKEKQKIFTYWKKLKPKTINSSKCVCFRKSDNINI